FGWFFEGAGGDRGPRLFALENGNLVAELQDGLFERLNALLLQINERQQCHDKRGAFSIRNRREVNSHAAYNRKATPEQLRLFQGLLRSYDFRVYCLALNALKQWLAAEQAATDRYLLGGRARQECRAAAATWIVTGGPVCPVDVEVPHPI